MKFSVPHEVFGHAHSLYVAVALSFAMLESMIGAYSAETNPINQHDVLPIFLLRCAECHGRLLQEGGLDIRRPEFLLKGGKSGPAIIPEHPEESLLVRRIRDGEMPPREKLASHSVKPVEPKELKKIEAWIAAGAPIVDVQPDVASSELDPLVTNSDREHWAFQAPKEVTPPALEQSEADGMALNPIDAFIGRKLNIQGLQFSSNASRQTLVRRVFMDLTGLPPESSDASKLFSNTDPMAYEKLIDRLLASPAYGERWGQFWLDLAGYADSEGVQHADPVRPHAYRYRDYVIRAFNEDKPYDRFLLEQIAGDELVDYEQAPEITSEIYDNLVATGFLRMSSDGTFAGITGFVPNRLDVIDDQIRILSSSVMGLSMRCARCHSHKFDPIPQRDYYRLAAVFKGAMDQNDWLRPIQSSVGKQRYLPFVTSNERRSWEKTDGELVRQIKSLKNQLEEIKKEKDEDNPADSSEEEVKKLEEQIKKLESQRQPEPMVRALWDRGDPTPTYVLRRGDYRQSARLVGPGVPSVLTDGKTPFSADSPWTGSKKTGNRLALAKWLVKPENPLTARVMVNRLWKHHFGRGLVEPLDDFGKAGGKPSHPELLDWLANEFVRNGWSIKHMHRLMLTSRTYRQSSDVTSDSARLDPDNRFMARMPMKRMEAEVLRDSLLSVSGKLKHEPYGPSDGVSARKDGLVTSKEKKGGWRRSIYIQKRRTQRLTILDNFDRPRMSPNCIDRPISNVAPQALHLMNNSMIQELSLALADRIIQEKIRSASQKVEALFLQVLSRLPEHDELEETLRTMDTITAHWNEAGEESSEAQRKALANVCHALMNSAAFLYLD